MTDKLLLSVPTTMHVPSIYQMAINNTARAIASQSPAVRDSDPDPVLNVFNASIILAAAFCKRKEDVLADLAMAALRQGMTDP
jgi:hypothetical protein